jgi:hypothetical protein
MSQVTREPLDTLEHLVNRVSSAIAGWVGQDGLAAMGLPVIDGVDTSIYTRTMPVQFHLKPQAPQTDPTL